MKYIFLTKLQYPWMVLIGKNEKVEIGGLLFYVFFCAAND